MQLASLLLKLSSAQGVLKGVDKSTGAWKIIECGIFVAEIGSDELNSQPIFHFPCVACACNETFSHNIEFTCWIAALRVVKSLLDF